ncbi:hypothetical protein [Vibrio phage BUCT006]|nr:hypothetical protein [Vibrio phage BUCT006]
MGYKTFEDMKHNIPEGATHYHNESDGHHFCWFKVDGNKWFVNCPDQGAKWYKCSREHHRIGIVQFLQTESPEEREALDMIDTTSKQVESLANGDVVEWDGEGLPPVGVECEKVFDGRSQIVTPLYYDDHKSGMVMFYYRDSGKHVALDYDWCLVENCTFRKPESPEQKAERERLEGGYRLYCEFCELKNQQPKKLENFKTVNNGADANAWSEIANRKAK